MSASDPHPVAYPYHWLQPVRYDLDQYRQFVAALDADLADLLAQHASGRSPVAERTAPAHSDQASTVDSGANLPPT